MSDEEKTVESNDVDEKSTVSSTEEQIQTVGAVKTKGKKRGKGLKVACYAALSLLLIFIVLIFSLGAIVKTSVNAVLPKVTGTPCSMGSCTFNPILGKISISNLRIGNPEGYAKKNAFELEKMVIDVGVSSLFSDKIVIEEITVKGMNVDFEVKMTETNLSRIKGNIDEFTKSDETPKEAPESGEESGVKNEETKGSSKKLQIDLIQFADNSVTTGAVGKTVTIHFADMTITDIGTAPGGATVGEVSSKIFTAIYDAVLKTAKDNGWDSLKSGTGKVYDKVKNFFGGDKK